jgi:4,5-DOPA dioxygenase extradiol
MTEKILPSVFVSHGAPSLAIEKNDTVEFLRGLGADLGRPRAILCVSAHWATRVPTISSAERPETIYDFGGFPAELYRVRYDAPGAPGLAARAAELLSAAGISSELSSVRGLDHGAWVPLSLMYPERNVPVTQLSVQPGAGASAHFRMGRALAPLRREGVLILATGGATHNLYKLGRGDVAPDWAARFDEWLDEKIRGGEYEALLDYQRLAPHAELAHPTDEHLLPLFVAAGAGENDAPGRGLHKGWTHGSLSMAAYAFGEDDGKL